MSVSDGNLANQTTFNNAFMSRTAATTTTSAITTFTDTTQSTSKDNGAIVTEGGLGVEKNISAGGTIKNADTTSSTTKDTGSIVTEGGLGVEENINAGGSITAVGAMAASNLSGTNTGDVTLSNVGVVPNATGATLAGQVLNLQPADAANPGVVSTTTQEFAGNKTFSGTVAVSNVTEAVSKDTGSVILEGGLGVEKNIYLGGNIVATGTAAASNLSGTNTGDITLSAIGASANANGATLSGQVLNLQPASASFGGVVTTGTQSIAGTKTFTGDVVVTGDLTVNGATVTMNVATLEVEDQNILVNNGGNDASSEGAGITVERTTTNATILHADALASKWKAGAAGSESEIMTVGSAQTITGAKTITTPMTYEEEGAAPANPAAGYRKLYAKSDGFYQLNSSGVESELGGGGSGSGGINYLDENPGAEVDTTGWAVYADLAGTVPVDGTSGSPNSTFTRTTSSPLRDIGSFLFTKNSGASRQGEGFSYDFTIDAADKGKVLQGSFDYAIASGTFVDDAMEVFIYDVTNSTLIYCSPSKLKNHSLAAEKFGFEFQTSTSSTSYRLIVHVGVTTNSANTIKFDNFIVGPQAKLYGSPFTDWQQYTVNITGSTSNPTKGTTSLDRGWWRRVGDSIEVRYEYAQSAPGSAGSGRYQFSLPPGLNYDTAKVNANVGAAYPSLGSGFVYDATGLGILVDVQPDGTNTNALGLAFANTATRVQNGVNGDLSRSSIQFSFIASVPITGWSSSVIMSSDANTAVTAASANGAGTNAMTTGTSYFLAMTSNNFDTHGASTVSAATNGTTTKSGWYYTFPTAGYYQVTSQISTNGANLAANSYVAVSVRKNGINYAAMGIVAASGSSQYSSINGTQIVYGKAGDYIELVFETSASTVTLANNQGSSVNVEKISGPAQIAASDSVSALYTGAPPTGTLNGSYNIVTYGTKVKDTHSAYSGGSYTVPANGTYSISHGTGQAASYSITQTAASVIFIDGSLAHGFNAISAAGAVGQIYTSGTVFSIPLLAGQVVTIRAFNQGTTPTYIANAFQNWFSIVRTGNY